MTTENKRWQCLLCGYVHEGPRPPEECPVCGAPADEFELCREEAPSAPKPSPNQWQCMVCNYVHDGTEPSGECPLCGATSDAFEPVEQTASSAPRSGEPRKVIPEFCT